MKSGYHQQKFMHASMRFHSAINQPNYKTVLTTPCGSCTNDATPLLVSKYLWYHGLKICLVPWYQIMFGTVVSNYFGTMVSNSKTGGPKNIGTNIVSESETY